ncbi:type IV pilus twitching motility protein PilT [Fangia hongkongensis]|uniref:type IV pilus twitching motility protein PilT n=1 Tax=Fangia hongkongensis TaxID=270495 RepID=UPI0003763905|nr:ATPase, T2SS/T4P/T4SS family [Fangia hongkongensis]MBK2124237.1 Flp pilus assembly complex ATPase component TadA [Fangia hongkongensis]
MFRLINNEPAYFLKSTYLTLLEKSVALNLSDITFQTNCPIFGTLHGEQHILTDRELTTNEVEDLINILYGSNAYAKVLSDGDIDFSYTLNVTEQKLRFRVNASLMSEYGHLGVQVSIRILGSTPPTLENLKTPRAIKQLSYVREGIVLICGATGSGKSTLLASMILARAEAKGRGEKILTYEAPIEYILPMYSKNSLISQSEIPRCMPSFAHAVRNALRRTPTAIMVGESRDRETIESVIEAALTGHCVYTTLHSESVQHALKRLLMVFPEEDKRRIAYDFFSTVKAIVWQSLVPSVDGERIALREYIVVDGELKGELLLSLDSKKIDDLIYQRMEEAQSTLSHQGKWLLDQELITEEVYQSYVLSKFDQFKK